MWAVLVIAGSIVFKGGIRYGLPRATDDVVAGCALVLVAPHVDVGLRPFDRTVVALLTFLAVVAVVFWVRRRVRGQQAPQQALDLRCPPPRSESRPWTPWTCSPGASPVRCT